MKTERKTSYMAYEKNKVPFIRLSGKWLSNIGFNVGTKFQLIKEKNKIILVLSNNSDQDRY